jgi:hypothetical protein
VPAEIDVQSPTFENARTPQYFLPVGGACWRYESYPVTRPEF